MAKKTTFSSMYRTAWSSIKTQCDKEAIKKCDFSKGLGPALDKLSKKCDEAWDMDPIPEKTLKSLKKDFDSVQKTIVKYVTQIINENEKHPEYGESWLNLHNALKRVDDQLVDELKDLGVPDCKKITGWKDKSAFEKRAVEGTKKEGGADLSEYVGRLMKELNANKGDLKKIAGVLTHKKMGMFFPYSPAVAEGIMRESSNLWQLADFIDKKLKENPPRFDLAEDALSQVRTALIKACAHLGKNKMPLKNFMDLNFYGVLNMQIMALKD